MSEHTAHPVAFISSAARAFPEYLSEALAVCRQRGVIPVMFERAAATTPEHAAAARSLIDEADLYIGIFGGDHAHDSLCETEYERAAACGIPRLVFVVGRDHPRKASETFLDRLRKRQTVAETGSAAEFRVLLEDALDGLGLRGETAKRTMRGVSKRAVRVFVASPRDVDDERARMPKVVESLNRTLGNLLNVVVELWRWEKEGLPAAGEAQAHADVELDKADVVLVIFWNRLGTGTGHGTTGTEGEVLRALESWGRAGRPQVMVYFCQRPSRLERDGLEQRLRLLEFRERLLPLVQVADYERADEFEWRVRDDLFTTIATLCVRRK